MLLANTTDKIQIVTSSTSAIDVSVTYMDLASGTVTPGRQNTSISSATTTDVLSAPASSTYRNVKEMTVRNKGGAIQDVTVLYDANGTDYELHKVSLLPDETLIYTDETGFLVPLLSSVSRVNYSTAAQGAGFSSDTYLNSSFVKFPSGGPAVGSMYRLVFDVVKTAAGTATPIITVRVGTAGTTGDTARHTLTFGAGTAAADTGVFEVIVSWRSVGASGVSQAISRLTSNLTTTGLSNAVKSVLNTASAYDTTVSGAGIGASYNGGTSASHTVQLQRAELIY